LPADVYGAAGTPANRYCRTAGNSPLPPVAGLCQKNQRCLRLTADGHSYCRSRNAPAAVGQKNTGSGAHVHYRLGDPFAARTDAGRMGIVGLQCFVRAYAVPIAK